MRKTGKCLGENADLFMKVDIFIDNAVHFPLDHAKPALHRETGYAEILLGDRDIQFFSQILQLLINLFGSHGVALINDRSLYVNIKPITGFHTSFEVENKAACIILQKSVRQA